MAGDWNAKLDERREGEEEVIGPNVLMKGGMMRSEEAEDNRNRMIELATAQGMVVSDTWFDKTEDKKCTYREKKECGEGEIIEVNKDNYEQLDMIMTNKRWKNSIIDVEAKHDSGINSDHVPVVARARVRLSAKKKGAQQRERLEYNKNQEEKEIYNAQLKEKLEGKTSWKEWEEGIDEVVKNIYKKKAPRKKKDYITEETWEK